MEVHGSVRIYLNLLPILKEELQDLQITNVQITEHKDVSSRFSFGKVLFYDKADFLLWKLCSDIYSKRNWNWGLNINNPEDKVVP